MTANSLTPGVDAPTWPAEYAERYRAAGYWRGETFGGVLRERADSHPDRVALVDPAPSRRTWTYRQLDDRVDRLAAGFVARGIRKGDRVVVQLPNVGEFVEVVFALFRIGALPVYALPAHRERDLVLLLLHRGRRLRDPRAARRFRPPGAGEQGPGRDADA